MNSIITKYRIFCTTNSRFEYIWDLTAPAACPVNGSHIVNLNSVTSLNSYKDFIEISNNFTTRTSNFYRCNTSSNNIILTLTTATNNTDRTIIIQKISSNNSLTITPFGSELIDGLATKILTDDKETIKIKCDGVTWSLLDIKENDGEFNYFDNTNDDFGKGQLSVFDGIEQTSISGIDNTFLRALNSEPTGFIFNNVTKTDVGLSNVQNSKVNFTSLVAPTVTDDSFSGYSIGSRWINTITQQEYVCLNATVGTATWVETTAGATGGEANTGSNIGAGGVGVFKQKFGTTLQFKNLNSSNKIIITDDVINNEVDIDVSESNLNILNLSGAPSSQVVGINDTQILTNKIFTLPKINDISLNNTYTILGSELVSNINITLPVLTSNDIFIFANSLQTINNKIIDADNNTLSNITNTSIKPFAAIDASKIADGTISNTEYQYLNGVTSNIQTQINALFPRPHLCLYHDSPSLINISTSYEDLQWNVQRSITSHFSHTVNTANITINTTGIYYINCCVTLELFSNNARTTSGSALFLDTGSGFVIQPGFIGYGYHHQTSNDQQTISICGILSLNAGNIIKIQSILLSGSTITFVNNACQITIFSIG